MCDHRVGFHRCVVRQWYNPSGAAVVTCLNATARTRRAERVVQSDVLAVWQVLHGTPSAPLISAQRVARFENHWLLLNVSPCPSCLSLPLSLDGGVLCGRMPARRARMGAQGHSATARGR